MNENDILIKIFNTDIQINENKYTINTRHGHITVITDAIYPKTLPEVQFNFNDKTYEERIKSCNFYVLLEKLQGKYCIYPIIFFCLSIIDNKHDKDVHVHLEEVQEIDDKMFLEWKASKTKPTKDESVMTGKMYFQKIADKKTMEL
ncbi:hypothetical protein BDAP_001112 [Binucleata daphniae]